MISLYASDRPVGGVAQISPEISALPVVRSMHYWLIHVSPRRRRDDAMRVLDHQFPLLPDALKRAAVESWEQSQEPT